MMHTSHRDCSDAFTSFRIMMKVEYWQNTETFKPIKRVGILISKDIYQNMLRKEIAKYTIILFFSLIFPNVV